MWDWLQQAIQNGWVERAISAVGVLLGTTGFSVWLCWYLIRKTVPTLTRTFVAEQTKMRKAFRRTMRLQREACQQESKEQQALFRQEADAQRAQYERLNESLRAEGRSDLSKFWDEHKSVLREHSNRLETLNGVIQRSVDHLQQIVLKGCGK